MGRSRADDKPRVNADGEEVPKPPEGHFVPHGMLANQCAERAMKAGLSVASESRDATTREIYRKARKGYAIDGISVKELQTRDHTEVCELLSDAYNWMFYGLLPQLHKNVDERIQESERLKKRQEERKKEDEERKAAEESFRSASADTEEVGALKSKLIKCQEENNELLKKIVQLQDTELSAARSVTETVQRDLRTWSTVAAQNCAAAVAPRKLQAALQKTTPSRPVEDRSRNLMVFGLPEDEGEESPEAAISSLLQELEEKPPLTASLRIGQKTEGKTRPIKITLKSRADLVTLLKKAKNLRTSEQYSRVYLHPDRTEEERLERRRALETLAKLKKENPARDFVLRRGVIECDSP